MPAIRANIFPLSWVFWSTWLSSSRVRFFSLWAASIPGFSTTRWIPCCLLYAFAWLGVCGAILTVWAASLFWRTGVGSRWSRIHHSLIAASSVMIAWFF